MKIGTVLAWMICLLVLACATDASGGSIDFAQQVAPIFEQHCLRCHNDRDRRGGLSLQSASEARAGSDSGKVIAGGQPEASPLLDIVTPSEGVAQMPKGESPLAAGEIETIRQWIAEGAEWPAELQLERPVWWSMRPLQRPTAAALGSSQSGDTAPQPTTADSFPIRNPIDAFVAARHAEAGIRPAEQAGRQTLIRRLYLDLLGLPPSPSQIEAFVSDPDPLAYEKLVEQLLASPHYGERWGRHWLDLARYGDSDGYLGDSLRPHAWVYRDWVIDAINRDLPYDRFSIEQLAGDLLDNPTLPQKIATGFHRNTLKNTEAGVDRELYRTKEVIDRVDTTGTVWLGLTLGCAECHDHKHDPISQKEFYQLYAFFNNADEVDIPAPRPWEVAEYEQSLQQWEAEHARLQNELQRLSEEDPQRAELKTELEEHSEQKPAAPSTKAPVFKRRDEDRRETFVHIRGVYDRHGDQVTPGPPAALHEFQPRGDTADRLDLARWLFDDENPLTARVAVNRIWQHLFGHGLVTTSDDFGTKGARPTHPLLLDWLATEFRRLGWSRKAIIRQIVTSSTYRMSSADPSERTDLPLSSRLLWRQNSFRVNAETIRDLHLSASGLLDRKVGGPGIRPPLPAFVTEVGRSVKWPVSEGGDRYRRGLYIFFKRTVPYPMLVTFDAPNSTASCSRRERSNSPLQALTLLNDPVFFECAEALGQRMDEHYRGDVDSAVREMFMRCLARSPSAQEVDYLKDAYRDLRTLAERTSEEPEMADDPELAAMVALARIVMNLDEFITRD